MCERNIAIKPTNKCQFSLSLENYCVNSSTVQSVNFLIERKKEDIFGFSVQNIMSSIDPKTFNEMLRKDKLCFTEMKSPIWGASSGYVFKGERLKAGIEYALTHFKEIAELEKKFIFNRPEQSTIAKLKAAKSFIGTYQGEPKRPTSASLRFHWFDPIAEFLIKCHLLALTDPEEFKVYIDDDGRKSQIWLLFGAPIKELETIECPTDIFQPIKFENKPFCTQIIFESADLPSAMDALFAECWHSSGSPWDIRVIFIQESLREEVIRRLNINRLDDNGKLILEEVGTEMGGRVFRNSEANIKFVFDVLPKYIKSQYSTCVNFFRTAADVNQLVKEVPCKLFSIWTEKIGLFYEVASKLNGSIIWSNSVGVIDENTAQTLYGFNDTHQT